MRWGLIDYARQKVACISHIKDRKRNIVTYPLFIQFYPTVPCEAGEYKSDERGAPECQECPEGHTSEAGAMSQDDCHPGK